MYYLTRPEKCDKFFRTYSQGGAKTPTGGIPVCTGKPANAPFDREWRSVDLVKGQSRRLQSG